MKSAVTLINIECSHCGKTIKKSIGHINRAKKIGLKLFCNKRCFGLSRRSNETIKERKFIKAIYDQLLTLSMTEEDGELELLQKMVYFQMDYAANPEKYRKERRRKQASHNEYCRQPEYKKWKKEYDEKYRAKKSFGAYWEAAILLKNLDNEIDYRESKRQNKLYHKSTTKRKRSWQKQLKQQTKNLRRLI